MTTWEELRGNWHTLRGEVQQEWDKLTNEDADYIQGRRPQLAERLRQRYGFTREQAEQAIEQWHARFSELHA